MLLLSFIFYFRASPADPLRRLCATYIGVIMLEADN